MKKEYVEGKENGVLYTLSKSGHKTSSRVVYNGKLIGKIYRYDSKGNILRKESITRCSHKTKNPFLSLYYTAIEFIIRKKEKRNGTVYSETNVLRSVPKKKLPKSNDVDAGEKRPADDSGERESIPSSPGLY